MPYKSRAQARKFHAMEKRGEIDPATVREFDRATNFDRLPEKVRPKRGTPKRSAKKRR